MGRPTPSAPPPTRPPASRVVSPWLWRLFRLPYGGVMEASEEGISFPASGHTLSWRDGVTLELKRGPLAQLQLRTLTDRAPRTVALLWPWKAAEASSRLAELRTAGLRQFLEASSDELLPTGQAAATQLGKQFIPHRLAEQWMQTGEKGRALYAVMDEDWVPSALRPALTALSRLASGGRALIDGANAAFVSDEIARLASMPQYESLTAEQLEAVVTMEDATLVVASAGSGKTRVIENRVRYLVEERGVPQAQILVLAFNRSVAKEVGARLAHGHLREVVVKTFHAMGLSILSEAEGRAVGLTPMADPDAAASLNQFVRGVLTKELNEHANGDVVHFLMTYLQPPLDESGLDARDASDRRAHEESLLAPLGMNGRRVKSYGEFLIASYLFEHQVPFAYEKQYPHSTTRHRPDFTLDPERKPHPVDFIEYYGIDRAGETREDIDREQYQGSMRWKDDVHAQFQTNLIKLHYYDFSERGADGFRALLGERLRAADYGLNRLSDAELVQALETHRLPQLIALAVTFLRLYKGSGLGLDELRARAASALLSRPSQDRARVFLRVFERVLLAYERSIAESGDADFEDMIKRSAEAVAGGAWRSPFTHVLVDEFQDISPLRAQFVRAFQRSESQASVFAVGDDFQSIYRFAGSQIRLMTEFGLHFGPHRKLPLTRTHRFSAALADATTRFILKNPGQLPKVVRGRPGADGRPITLIRTDADSRIEGFEMALELARATTRELGGPRKTLLLGRYRADEPASLTELQDEYPELGLRFSTIHRAKGAEADIVILLNLTGGVRGFPSRVQDDPLMKLVLGETDAFLDAEERRLLYVALTRARERAIVLAYDAPPSGFCRELCSGEYGQWVELVDLREGAAEVPCPVCRDGHLVVRRGQYGEFLGCTNFPHCVVKRAR